MKIAFFCNEFPPKNYGGFGIFVQILSRELARLGHEITIIELGNQSSTRYQDGIRFSTISYPKIPLLSWISLRLCLWVWILGQVRCRKIDILEIPDFEGILPLPVPLRVVVRLHKSLTAIRINSGQKLSLRIYLLEMLTIKFSSRWIGVSKFIIEHTEKLFHCSRPRKCAIIFNPVNFHNETVVPDNLPKGRLIIFIGTVCILKGAVFLAKAMKDILNEIRDIHLVYVGKINTNEKIIEQIRAAVGENFERKVHLLGQKSHQEVRGVLSKATALCLPSNIESFAIVVAEAITVGVPVIVPDEPPFTEYVENGKHGLRIQKKSVEEWKSGILKILMAIRSDTIHSNSLEAKSNLTFDPFVCAQKTLQLYQS